MVRRNPGANVGKGKSSSNRSGGVGHGPAPVHGVNREDLFDKSREADEQGLRDASDGRLLDLGSLANTIQEDDAEKRRIYARALMEARIQILVNEAMATSALEGVVLDPKAVRKAVLIRLAKDLGVENEP